MSSDLLLDTSAVVELLKNNPVTKRVLANAPRVYLSAISLGELLHGAEKSIRPAENTSQVREFSATLKVLPCDEGTAAHYGSIRRSIERKGRPLPVNDVWIAAVARQHDLTVVTGDKHFHEVPDLSVLSW